MKRAVLVGFLALGGVAWSDPRGTTAFGTYLVHGTDKGIAYDRDGKPVESCGPHPTLVKDLRFTVSIHSKEVAIVNGQEWVAEASLDDTFLAFHNPVEDKDRRGFIALLKHASSNGAEGVYEERVGDAGNVRCVDGWGLEGIYRK